MRVEFYFRIIFFRMLKLMPPLYFSFLGFCGVFLCHSDFQSSKCDLFIFPSGNSGDLFFIPGVLSAVAMCLGVGLSRFAVLGPTGPFPYENISSRPGKIFFSSFSLLSFSFLFFRCHICVFFVFVPSWVIPSNPSVRPMSTVTCWGSLLCLPFKASPVQLHFLLPSAWTSCTWEFSLLNFSLSLFPRFAPSAWNPSSSNPLSDPTPSSRLSSYICSLKLFHPCLRLSRLLQQSTLDWVVQIHCKFISHSSGGAEVSDQTPP